MGYLQTLNSKAELKRTILIFIFGGVTNIFWCLECYSSWDSIWIERYSLFFSGSMWVLLWQGNGHLSDYISSKISWLENPSKRFIWGIVGVILYSPAAVYFLYLVGVYIFNVRMSGIGSIAIIAIGITFVMSFFLNAAQFLKNWKQTALDAEKLKKEQMASKYESLKNQVNPHFLFNSLNALTNLVYEDQDQAANFIRQLSKVYRYVLDTRAQEVVELKTEMEFVDSYLYLQKIRFDEKLKVEIDLKGFETSMVPPMSIQMLMENAIKHNTIAKDEPLTIQIKGEENKLVVSNNLQKKNIPVGEISGTGLNNLVSRYEFLSQEKVDVIETDREFTVKLPLLNFDK